MAIEGCLVGERTQGWGACVEEAVARQFIGGGGLLGARLRWCAHQVRRSLAMAALPWTVRAQQHWGRPPSVCGVGHLCPSATGKAGACAGAGLCGAGGWRGVLITRKVRERMASTTAVGR